MFSKWLARRSQEKEEAQSPRHSSPSRLCTFTFCQWGKNG
jgi:hypothetical protein